MAISPGMLRYPIELHARDLYADASGYTQDAGGCHIETSAHVRGVKALEGVEAGAEQITETLEFTIRWRSDLDTSMLVRHRGRDYEIERIDPTPYEGRYRRIWAHSIRGVGT